MENKYQNDAVLMLLSLSEEIISLNTKMKQMVHELSSNRGGLAIIRDLATQIQTKSGDFNKILKDYKAPPIPDTDASTASWESSNNTRERIVPGPDNAYAYATATATTVIEDTPIDVPMVDTVPPPPSKPRRKTTKKKAAATKRKGKSNPRKPLSGR